MHTENTLWENLIPVNIFNNAGLCTFCVTSGNIYFTWSSVWSLLLYKMTIFEWESLMFFELLAMGKSTWNLDLCTWKNKKSSHIWHVQWCLNSRRAISLPIIRETDCQILALVGVAGQLEPNPTQGKGSPTTAAKTLHTLSVALQGQWCVVPFSWEIEGRLLNGALSQYR